MLRNISLTKPDVQSIDHVREFQLAKSLVDRVRHDIEEIAGLDQKDEIDLNEEVGSVVVATDPMASGYTGYCKFSSDRSTVDAKYTDTAVCNRGIEVDYQKDGDRETINIYDKKDSESHHLVIDPSTDTILMFGAESDKPQPR